MRWTEQRNFQAVLYALATGDVRTDTLVSHRFSIDRVLMHMNCSAAVSHLGILPVSKFSQPLSTTLALPSEITPSTSYVSSSSQPLLSVIGAGNYSRRTLIPSLAQAGARFHTIAATSGLGPAHVGRKFGFRYATTDISSLLSDPSCNTVVIATRHDSHASLVQECLSFGKHVFVEKPLCLTVDELSAIEAAYTGETILMVGFNRRFAPLFTHLQDALDGLSGPKSFIYTCNAGAIPPEHWSQDISIGGGRLLGEACHFVDLLRNLAGSPIQDFYLLTAADNKPCPDTFSLQMRFDDGSIGTVHYLANGSKAFPKERLEVFAAGKVFCLDNFRKLKAWGLPGFRTRRLFTQDKGHSACCAAFLKAIENGGPSPIPVSELFEVQGWLLGALSK